MARLVVPDREFDSVLTDKLVRRDYAHFVQKDCCRFTESDFLSTNRLGYSLFLETWTRMFRDSFSSAVACNVFKKTLQINGVCDTIKWACALGEQILDAAVRKQHFISHTTDNRLAELEYRISRLPLRTARQLCLYGKRFTPYVPQKASVHHADVIHGFVDVDQYNRSVVKPRLTMLEAVISRQHDLAIPAPLSGHWRYGIILNIAKTIISDIVGEYEGVDDEYVLLGTGAASNCGSSPYERISHILCYSDRFSPRNWPSRFARATHPRLRHATKGRASWDTVWYGSTGPVPQVSELASVPKNVSKRRGIGKEDPINMDMQLKLKELLDHRVRRSIHAYGLNLHDQSLNKMLAKIGAYTDKVATLDASHASDSVTKTLVRLLFPHSWWEGFRSCIPYAVCTHMNGDAITPIECFATMGCGCTFIVESLVFYALGLACYWFYHHQVNNVPLSSCWHPAPCKFVRTYGDDLLVPSEIAALVIEVLAFCGIQINNEKSYMAGPFRESCGADWFAPAECQNVNDVMDISVCYWPRSPFAKNWEKLAKSTCTEWQDDTRITVSQVSKAISLQHHLWDVSPSAARWLGGQLLANLPALSTSLHDGEDEQICLQSVWVDQPIQRKFVYVGLWYPPTEPGLMLRRFLVTRDGAPIPDGYVAFPYLREWLATAYGRTVCQCEYGDLVRHAVRYGYTVPAVRKVECQTPELSGVLEMIWRDTAISDRGECTSIPSVVVQMRRVHVSPSGVREWVTECSLLPPSLWCGARPTRLNARSYLTTKTVAELTLKMG